MVLVQGFILKVAPVGAEIAYEWSGTGSELSPGVSRRLRDPLTLSACRANNATPLHQAGELQRYRKNLPALARAQIAKM
jgi:hypothetical protein